MYSFFLVSHFFNHFFAQARDVRAAEEQAAEEQAAEPKGKSRGRGD